MKHFTIGLAATLIFITGCHTRKKETAPMLRMLTAAVYASGTLVPENEYKVVSNVEGFLVSSLVKEGDSVRKGQLLFSVSNENQQTQVSAAAGVLKKTIPVTAPNAPSIQDLETRLASSENRLQNDSLQYQRYQRIYQQGAISSATYEKYKLQYETSQHDVQSLREQLKQQRLSAALQLQQASNELEIARTARGNGLLKSYTDGILYELYKQNGDLVGSSQPIALIGSGRIIARLLVDEDDLGKIQKGQLVLITMDAYPDKIFRARIEKIYPLLNKQEQSFRVDAIFEEPIPISLYGLNIEANIVLQEKARALVIPKKALLKGDSVMVRQGDHIAIVKIRKGAEDKEFVQVLSGLDSSVTIIQP
ncbi:MAG TPA: efflux RND transporter periplasmic adaptor subunit [Puia sp.]|nr:efflux RND transporter periplasmic adaptor subunit [Puia sp.]